MAMTKRDFLKGTGTAMGAAVGVAAVGAAAPGAMAAAGAASAAAGPAGKQSPDVVGLTPLTDAVTPITRAEREARLVRAQALMRAHEIDALVLEPGASEFYFTGVTQYRSERFHGTVIPAEGAIAYVTPAFEEPRLREKISIGEDVRIWQEHENPFLRVAQILADRGLSAGRLGMEETVRFFVSDGIAEAAPGFALADARPVVTGCRAIKSAAEIALMQTAFDITLAAYRAVVPQLEAGMTPADFRTLMNAATEALGGRPVFASAQFGEASAYPHGSSAPQVLKPGDVVLMDCGCEVEGYNSDISRTLVFGEPSARHREVWALAKQAQMVAFAAAQPGAKAEAVDKAARAFLVENGFGPGYETPGLPHRTGHGIGLDGHEAPNFVLGEETLLAPGMCFSNEPGIYIYGDFGVRLEDCITIAEDGPRWFTEPALSLDRPV